METMTAQVIEGFGEPGVFKPMEIAKPQAAPGHVLIRVEATSVNPVDYKIRSGVASGIAAEFPAVLHGDAAGVVEAVGEGVTAFKPGDEVYACAGGVKGLGGALADYFLADATLVAHKPKTLDMAQTAALPLVGITAWEAMIERAKVRPGQTVLVHGGTGGVGHMGVQLAKWAGAKVYTTVSSSQKGSAALGLGADGVINYREKGVNDYVQECTSGKGFDVVFDTVGGSNLDKCFEAAALNGTVVSISTHSTHNLGPMHSKGLSLHVVFMLIPMLYGVGRARHGAILANIAQLVDEGKLKPLVDPTKFTFSQTAQAHQYAQSGEAIGKVVISR